MRIVMIGGSGHVGTYLVPRLVEAGHEVVNITRGQREPYHAHPAWRAVQNVVVDRGAEDEQGVFGRRVRALEPDVVMDMICFTEASARQLVEALRGEVQHFLHCGTIWSMGHSVEVPATEEMPRHPFGEYGIQKSAIQDYLLDQAQRHGFPATVLQPGHIAGPGWIPINPAGNLDPDVFTRLAHGEEVTLPNLGMETLHHVHADDVAQSFMQAMANHSVSVGEAFHVVSPAALTLRGYAESVAHWFGQTANLKFLPWDDWCKAVSDEYAAQTWDHIAHSPNASLAKAQRLLDYHPRYTSLQAIYESLEWLIGQGIVKA
ncbi:MAG TPA: NAD-dependent epimerase/dehydratase family protein [Anaerolineales bacterium]|nr:NAD-dependent epimerase/dehydratase family protein [Anaerolineales bacterium]